MDKDKDAKLTFEEFVEGSKQDPTIIQVSHSRSCVISLSLVHPSGALVV
jgi:hypothetical protein